MNVGRKVKRLNNNGFIISLGIACMVTLFSVVSTASSPAFKCTGSEDICNVHDVDQYCGPSPGGYKRCIPCSHNQQSCGQSHMPLECYNYCIGLAVHLEIQEMKEIPCSQLMDVDHGEFNTSSHTNQSIGTVVQIVCDVGYRLVGNHLTECLEFGRWSSPSPVCKDEDSTMMKIAVVFGCALFLSLLVIGIFVYYLRTHHLEQKTCAPKPNTRQVGINIDTRIDVTEQESQHPNTCKVAEVDETNQRDSTKHSSAIPLLPRPLPPSAPSDNINSDKTDVKNSSVKAKTNAAIPADCSVNTTNEVIKPPTTANGHSYIRNKESASTIIHAKQVNLFQNNGNNARVNGHIGKGVDKRTAPKKCKRELSHESKEEVECLLPTEETGITKHAEQPEDHDEINDPKLAL